MFRPILMCLLPLFCIGLLSVDENETNNMYWVGVTCVANLAALIAYRTCTECPCTGLVYYVTMQLVCISAHCVLKFTTYVRLYKSLLLVTGALCMFCTIQFSKSFGFVAFPLMIPLLVYLATELTRGETIKTKKLTETCNLACGDENLDFLGG